MDWPTLATSLGSAVIVAFLTPRFQHVVWKRQKLREQRLAMAERFANLGADFSVLVHLTPQFGVFNTETEGIEKYAKFLEQEALLVVIPVLFERSRTLDDALNFKRAISIGSSSLSDDDIRTIYALRVDLLACLFAEAL